MSNIPVGQFYEFFYNILYSLLKFINEYKIVKWFVLVPIAFTFLCIIFYFVFDVTHLLDDYKSKHQMYYKGNKNNNFYNRRYKNKFAVKYGDFSKDYTYKDGQAYKKNILKKDEIIDVNSSYEDKVKFAKTHNKSSENLKIKNYYERQQANREADREFNRKHNYVFDIAVEDENL